MKSVDTEARYRLLAENSSDIVCLVGIDGTLQWISPSVTRVLGWDPEALAGTQPWDLVHADDRAEALTALAKASTVGDQLSDATLRFRTAAGEYLWLAATAAHATPDAMVVSFRLADAQVRAQQALAASEARYRELVETASDVIMRQSPTRIVEYVSPSVERMLGWRPEDLVGKPSHAFWHPDDSVASAHVRTEVAAGRGAHIRGRGLCKDGSYRWLEVNGQPVFDPAGEVVATVSIIRDVDAQVRSELAVAEAEGRYRLLAENTMDLVALSTPDALFEWVSPSVETLLGYQPSDLVGRSASEIMHPEDRHLVLDASALATAPERYTYRGRVMTAAGQPRWLEITVRPLRDEAGTLVRRVVAMRDIDLEVEARQQLEHEAAYDALTGLANRTLALARIEALLDPRGRRSLTLVGVGVDGMTAINQAYTHAAGDQVLIEVGRRLVEAVGSAERVARIAGDEFVVMMPEVVTDTDAARSAERILASVRGSVVMGEASVTVSACAGIVMATGGDAASALRDAIAAMRQAGARGTGRWQFLDGDVQERTRRSLELKEVIEKALDEDRMRAWLMPLTRMKDGVVEGYEALVRLHHQDGTVAGPPEFLDVAERTGQVVDIDRAMIAQALAVLAAHDSVGHIAVNIAAATLSSGDLAQVVRMQLERTGVDAERLHLEVTETSLLQVSGEVRMTMRALADLGVSWWVDDFGTGFSSISHLRDLPIRGMKLDQTFTAGVTLADSKATRLADGLIGLARGLGLDTVAEGIETQEQAQVLLAQGWRLGQGWLFGVPAPGIVDA